MCGIFAYTGDKNAAPLVLSGLKRLEYRGYDSWGIAVKVETPTGKNLKVVKHIGKIGNATIDGIAFGTMAMGHTRWATHGGVTVANAHPHLNKAKTIAVIHNGIIENYDRIKEKLLSIGYTFQSETDTEVAAALFDYLYKQQREKTPLSFLQSVAKGFSQFEGLNAMIVMDSFSGALVGVKTGSPLAIGKGKNENLIASDAMALLPFTRDVRFLEDGEITLITKQIVEIYDFITLKKKEYQSIHLDWPINEISRGKYPHFMIKEIEDQKQVIASIATCDASIYQRMIEAIKASYGTYLVGCGTAAYACLAGAYLFSKIANRHVNFSVGSEFIYLAQFITDKSLVLALSQSGETIDVLEAVKKAKEKNATVGALVNVLGSSLYRTSQINLLLGAGVEQAVVSTKAFTAKIAHLIRISYLLASNDQKGREIVQKVHASIENVLSKNNQQIIANCAKMLAKKHHMYVIGRGLSFPVALETALKIKESSYIHAEGFASGELKHGVIALIEKGSPVIAFLPADETYQATLAGVMEMKARGAYIIGVSTKPHEMFDIHIPFWDAGDGSIIPMTIIGQLFGYYLSTSKGIDPDKPRNLAKSVTVK